MFTFSTLTDFNYHVKILTKCVSLIGTKSEIMHRVKYADRCYIFKKDLCSIGSRNLYECIQLLYIWWDTKCKHYHGLEITSNGTLENCLSFVRLVVSRETLIFRLSVVTLTCLSDRKAPPILRFSFDIEIWCLLVMFNLSSVNRGLWFWKYLRVKENPSDWNKKLKLC